MRRKAAGVEQLHSRPRQLIQRCRKKALLSSWTNIFPLTVDVTNILSPAGGALAWVLHATCRHTSEYPYSDKLHPLIVKLILRIGPVAKLHIANKTRDIRKALIQRGKLKGTTGHSDWTDMFMSPSTT